MIRVAIVVVSRNVWTGGYNYFLNLVRTLSQHKSAGIEAVAFFGEDFDDEQVSAFAAAGAETVRSPVFNQSKKYKSLLKALVLGRDGSMSALFGRHRVDAVLEVGRYYGWRLRVSIIAWIPDLQHRLLPQFYSTTEFWKRECGFRMQVLTPNTIMLSSADARRYCEQMYPGSIGKTQVVHFAVPAPAADDQEGEVAAPARMATLYGLPQDFFFLPNQYWKHKNHECVIRAAAIAKGSGRSVVVASSGNPMDLKGQEHFKSLQRLVDELKVTENFRFLGMIPAGHVARLMQECAALINPSTCEGWSTTVEEAKATGTPMLLSDIDVHREQAHEAALFFDPTRPEDLAFIFSAYVPMSALWRRAAARSAAEQSRMRLRTFAADFAAGVRHAIGGSRHRKLT